MNLPKYLQAYQVHSARECCLILVVALCTTYVSHRRAVGTESKRDQLTLLVAYLDKMATQWIFTIFHSHLKKSTRQSLLHFSFYR